MVTYDSCGCGTAASCFHVAAVREDFFVVTSLGTGCQLLFMVSSALLTRYSPMKDMLDMTIVFSPDEYDERTCNESVAQHG